MTVCILGNSFTEITVKSCITPVIPEEFCRQQNTSAPTPTWVASYFIPKTPVLILMTLELTFVILRTMSHVVIRVKRTDIEM